MPRIPRPRALRRACVLAIGVFAGSAACAQADAPIVAITKYSPTVSGNVGTATADVDVTVALQRNGQTVATAPATTTDADGHWEATLPAHVPSYNTDIVTVGYSGTDAPPSVQYQMGTVNFVLPQSMVAADGGSIVIPCGYCQYAVGLAFHVAYADGTSQDVSSVPNGLGGAAATLTPAVGLGDVVTVVTPINLSGASGMQRLVIAQRLGLPGITAPPDCSGDLATAVVTCSNLPAASFDIVRTRAGQPNVTQTGSAIGGTLSAEFGTLHADDVIELHAHGVPTAITSTILQSLRVDAAQFTASTLTATGGECPSGVWLSGAGVGDIVCPADGTLPSGFSGSTSFGSIVRSWDETGPGSTAVTAPGLLYTSPVDGENVYGGDVTAFADASVPGTRVALAYAPRGGGATVAVPGNANSFLGVPITGLAAGTRYTAQWLATDANGDATTRTTAFNGQPGGTGSTVPGDKGDTGDVGPTGAAGAIGAAGAAGAAGPTGAKGTTGATGATGDRGPEGAPRPSTIGVRSVAVSCRAVGTKPRCKAKLALGFTHAGVSLRLNRGEKTYATGNATTKSRHASIALRLRRPLPRGRYGITFVVTRGGNSSTGIGSTRVR